MDYVTMIVQNIKMVKIMKSTGYKDAEIAAYCGIPTKYFLETIEADEYLKEMYATATEKIASEIEKLFIKNTMAQLEAGDNTDAKWLLERTNKKYQKTDKVDVTVRTIDDIIRETGE